MYVKMFHGLEDVVQQRISRGTFAPNHSQLTTVLRWGGFTLPVDSFTSPGSGQADTCWSAHADAAIFGAGSRGIESFKYFIQTSKGTVQTQGVFGGTCNSAENESVGKC